MTVLNNDRPQEISRNDNHAAHIELYAEQQAAAGRVRLLGAVGLDADVVQSVGAAPSMGQAWCWLLGLVAAR